MRQAGYYWVRINANWCVCKWEGGEWYHFNWEGGYKDSDFDEIDERRIERELSVEEKNAKNDIDWEADAKQYRKIAADLIVGPIKVIPDDSIPPDEMWFETVDGVKTVRISLKEENQQ